MLTEVPTTCTADGELLEEHAFRFGQCYDSYLALEPGRSCYWSAGREGAISYVRSGRYLHASGGLLAPDEHKESLLAEFVAFANARDFHVSFYNVTDDELPLLRRYGFQATKWGGEAMLDLADCTWEGKAYEWVRRQSNYCQRQGLVFSEASRDVLAAEPWGAVLAQISEVWPTPLAGKPQAGEIKFLEGSFDPMRLGRRRIFLATSDEGAGRIEGFLIANPAAGGTTWVFETYRHRPDAPRGCVSFLMHQALLALQAEGMQRVSLCLVPGLACGQPLAGDSALARWGLSIGSRYFNFIFDSAGLYHFKTRFRPRFESRYLCARPRVTFGSAWSFIKLLGVLQLDAGKLASVIRQRLRKANSRATMSTAGKTTAAS